MITSLRHDDPGIVFLSEAFSHPDVMLQLSRIGFSVSYTHFPWQHTPGDIENYTTMMLSGDRSEFFRGSAWVNTPDILTDELQQGARQVFESRLILAATLSASFGVYGPVFELQVSEAVDGTEEYAHGEKYEVRSWDLDSPQSLRGLMTHLNSLRHRYSALQHDRALRFHRVSNPRFVAYTKTAPARRSNSNQIHDPVLTIVNTDHWNVQEGMVTLDPTQLPRELGDVFVAHDLLSGESYHWHAGDNFVRLEPWHRTAHVLALRPLELAGDGVRG
jgi:starch synthase (maltosyl-transferring)